MLKRIANYITVMMIIITVFAQFAYTDAALVDSPAVERGVLENRVIILDAGHGVGQTSVYEGYNEQETMLKLAKKIKTELESHGATVYMTRPDQNHVDHPVRAALINKWALQEVKNSRQTKLTQTSDQTELNALQNEINEIDRLLKIVQSIIDDPEKNAPIYLNYVYEEPYDKKINPEWQKVFEFQNDPSVRDRFLAISLHSDATGTPADKTINGSTVFHIANTHTYTVNYYNNYSNETRSRQFGEQLLDNMSKLGIVKRNIQFGAYSIIREHNVPAVLVENGFHTNDQDRAKLLDDAFLDKLAVVYTDTITDYFGKFEPLSLPEQKSGTEPESEFELSLEFESESDLKQESEPEFLELAESLLLSTPEHHNMPKSFIVYKQQSFKSNKIATFSPQEVFIYEKTDNGWGLIDTYLGKYWVYIGDVKIAEKVEK